MSAAPDEEDNGVEDEQVEAPRFPRDPRWRMGPSAATRGSLHSDFWEGSAAEVADMQHIAIYPMTGWWKTRVAQRRFDAIQPYSLIVTLESLSGQLDIYTEIANAIAIATPVDL